MTTVGVIGVGNMGSALVKGWLRGDGAASPGRAGAPAGMVSVEAEAPALVVWDRVDAAVQKLRAEVESHAGRSVSVAASLEQLADAADLILVVVKPKDAGELLGGLRAQVGERHIVVSAMAGLRLDWLREALGPGPQLFRVMPNLAVEVGAGATVVAAEPAAQPNGLDTVVALFGQVGLVEVLPEETFDAVTAVAGAGPAFLAVAIEGLEDGAVAAGLSRAAARTVVRRAAAATAHELLDRPDSAVPARERLAGASDAARATSALLEERGVRGAFRRAVQAAVERSKQMRKV